MSRRGIRIFVWSSVAAVVLVTGALIAISQHDWSDQSPRADATGQRSQQRAGESQGGKSDAATGQAQNERFEQVTGSARPLALDAEQRRRLREQIAAQGAVRTDTFESSISIGASVPRQIALHDLPTEMADTLGGYHGSKYIVVREQMVIVDEARRIVAIIPAG